MSAPLDGLIDRLERVWIIFCSPCGEAGVSYVVNVRAAAVDFRGRGWRFNHPRVMCPKCVHDLTDGAA